MKCTKCGGVDFKILPYETNNYVCKKCNDKEFDELFGVESSLKDRVFQNHMEVELRGYDNCIVWNGFILSKEGWRLCGCKAYNEDLRFKAGGECWDIMKATTPFTNEVIYERDETDWGKVPVDTKVWVKDEGDDEWNKAHFSHKQGRYHCYRDGKTSFTSNGECYAWDYCKLAKEGN